MRNVCRDMRMMMMMMMMVEHADSGVSNSPTYAYNDDSDRTYNSMVENNNSIHTTSESSILYALS